MSFNFLETLPFRKYRGFFIIINKDFLVESSHQIPISFIIFFFPLKSTQFSALLLASDELFLKINHFILYSY